MLGRESRVSSNPGADSAGDYRRLQGLQETGHSEQEALARPQWERVAAATPLKPAQRYFHTYHMMCWPRSWKFYQASAQASQQGSHAYTGRCWAESAVRLMRVSGGLTEMTKRSTK